MIVEYCKYWTLASIKSSFTPTHHAEQSKYMYFKKQLCKFSTKHLTMWRWQNYDDKQLLTYIPRMNKVKMLDEKFRWSGPTLVLWSQDCWSKYQFSRNQASWLATKRHGCTSEHWQLLRGSYWQLLRGSSHLLLDALLEARPALLSASGRSEWNSRQMLQQNWNVFQKSFNIWASSKVFTGYYSLSGG